MNFQLLIGCFDSRLLEPHPHLPGAWKRFIHPTPQNNGLILGLGELPTGLSVGWQAHGLPEFMCILEGRGTASWEHSKSRRSGQLRPGSLLLMRPHAWHDYQAEETLRFVYGKIDSGTCTSPSIPVAGDEEMATLIHTDAVFSDLKNDGQWKFHKSEENWGGMDLSLFRVQSRHGCSYPLPILPSVVVAWEGSIEAEFSGHPGGSEVVLHPGQFVGFSSSPRIRLRALSDTPSRCILFQNAAGHAIP